MMSFAHAGGERGGGRGFWWMVVTCAVVVFTIGGGRHHVAAAVYPVRLTSEQEHRGVTTAINHHSFAPPLLRQYYGDGEIPHWRMSSAAVITDNYVRLTGDQKSQVGHLWNIEPLDMDAFEVVVGFRVHRPQGGFGADGFSVWVADPPRHDGPILGRRAGFNGFGILFDSYDNDNRRDNPMVSLVVNDGSVKKRFSPENDFMGDNSASCVFDYVSVSGSNMATMRMVYNRGDLSVFLSVNREASETHCFSVTSVSIPEGNAFLSVSAMTGGVSEVHDIIFVHLSPLEDVTYDHDVHEPKMPDDDMDDAQIYDTEAMNNRQRTTDVEDTPSPSPPPSAPSPQGAQQQNPPPQPPQQQPPQQSQQPHEQQNPPPPQQPHEQQNPPPPQQPHEQQNPPPQPPQQQPPQQPQQPREQQNTPPPQQPHEQQNPPLPKVGTDAAADERQRIQELEKKLAELQRRNTRRTQRRDQDDVEYEDEDDEYFEEENNPRRGRRVRRARTPRRNRVEYDD